MYRTGNNVEIKLRLNEINRRSVALSTTSSELANLAAQLDHLRQVNERISHLAVRMSHSKRREGDCLSRDLQGRSRLGIPFPLRDLADEY
jgi:hypothetical protein